MEGDYESGAIIRVNTVILINTRTIRKVTSGEMLTKQATRKNYYIQKIHTNLSYFSM
jgi:hypothetical protein